MLHSQEETAVTIGTRLKQARTRLGLTLGEVHEAVKVGVSTLSDYENDKREPGSSQLAILARHYRVPVGYLFGEVELPTEHVLWRHKPETAAAKIEGEFLELCHWYKDLERWADEEDPGCLHPLADGSTLRDPDEVARVATSVRNALNLGGYPALTLAARLEDSCGIKIFQLPLGGRGNAASAVGDFGMAVLLNGDNGPFQRGFDLAHELFHLLTWHARGEATSPSAEEEVAADHFAVQLLVPAERLAAVAKEFVRRKATRLVELVFASRRFRVPVEALVRALDVALGIGETKVAALVARCREYDEILDPPDGEKPTRPQRFIDLAVKAYQLGAASTTVLTRYLGMPLHKAMAMLNAAMPDDEADIIAV